MTTPLWTVVRGTIHRDGEPVLLLGGQVHNSTSSSPEAIEDAFRHVRALGGNTVIAPVCWDLSEPHEGEYDFDLLDRMLAAAAACDLRLVVLWFGAFKNAASTYAPSWVRADPVRFPRARADSTARPVFTYEGATPKPVLSVFSPELRSADGRAFEGMLSALARHPHRDRVALVQVENEVGLLGDSRDRSPVAQAAWDAEAPAEFLAFLRDAAPDSTTGGLWRAAGAATTGTWSTVLGDGWEADEVFMAWGFASYVEELAARGSAIWPVPFYANAWLGPQPGQERAGQYPSGGPGARVLDVWRAAAPTLSMVSPDIYVDDAASVIAAYDLDGDPLFVPECRMRAADLVLAVARGAIGWSAFGIDDGRCDGQLSQLLGPLASIEGTIVAAQRDDRLAGVVLDDGVDSAEVRLDGVRIVARGTRALFARMLLDAGVPHLPPSPELPAETRPGARIGAPHDTRPFALILAEGGGSFLLIGEGVTVDFVGEGVTVEIDSAVEQCFADGRWMPGRALNGDERLELLPSDRVGAVRIRVVRLPA